MNRALFAVVFGVLMLAASAVPAQAGTIGPTCGSCQGGIYTLTNLGLVADLDPTAGLNDTYRFLLEIDTSGYTGTGVRIDEVAVKVASSTDEASLVAAPGGTAVWQVKPGGISAGGCSGSGSGFECGDWVTGSLTGAFLSPANTYFAWTFDIDISSPLLTGAEAPSIKVRYVSSTGAKVGDLVSEKVPEQVPEPATLSLLGLAAIAGAAARRRRTKAERAA